MKKSPLWERRRTITQNEVLAKIPLAEVEAEMVSRNMCDLVTPPRIVSREVVPLSVEQAGLFMKHIRGHRLEVLVTVAVVTGMRRGELLALRWADIDFGGLDLAVHGCQCQGDTGNVGP